MRAYTNILIVLSLMLTGCTYNATTSTARFDAAADRANLDVTLARRAAANTANMRSATGESGKGVLVARNGQVWLVTADHVFGQADTATATVAGRTFKVTRTRRGPASDFSVTKVYTGGDLPVEADLAIAPTDLPASEYGVPVAEFIRPQVFSHAGTGSISRVFNDRWFMFSTDLNPGFGSSGSGLYSVKTGELVGIYAATTDVSKTGIYVKPQTIARAIDNASRSVALASN
ncbi:MAG: hypothetical protein GC159_16980 [Phycisphaera sp.]|nr:hypothetical protein [Phycisphaera sp.]